jgi:N-methylhydantoinase A
MQSNGGIIQARTAGEEAARTGLSGPAGGVVGARFVAEMAGFPDIITFDMGGTSTDVALCPGRLPVTAENEIAGLPLRLPMIDIHTVGAGGGSLAYVDAGGALHVGPQSAGADPGPACYNKLPQVPSLREDRLWATTTDANMVLGRLDADHFLGGEMLLERQLAHDALDALAAEIGESLVAEPAEVPAAESAEARAAWGVVQVANANMERAIRRISVERGYDPRRFTLVAFGGAGPLHACEMAANLQINRVLIPAVPGVLSALGMLVAAPTRDYSQTVMRLVEGGGAALDDWLAGAFDLLAQRAAVEMTADGYPSERVMMQPALDMRYKGQSHELTVRLPAEVSLAAVLELFHTAHEQRYGYRQPEEKVEIVTVRLTAVAAGSPPEFESQSLTPSQPERALIGRKEVWFNQRPVETNQYDRSLLQPGDTFEGAAVIYQYDTTTVIPPDWRVRVDLFGNLVVEVVEEEG